MRHRLFWLAVAALVPLVALAAGLSVYSFQQQRIALRNEAMHDVADMLDRVERDLLAQISNLQTLAKSPSLDGPEPDLALFHKVAGEVAEELRHWDVIILADLQGRQILDTRFPVGRPPGRVVDDESYKRLISTGAPVVGNVVRPAANASEGPPRAAVRVPVTRDGALRYVLTAVIAPAHLSELVARKLPPEWRSFLVDHSGRIAASARRPDVIGQARASRPGPHGLPARPASTRA